MFNKNSKRKTQSAKLALLIFALLFIFSVKPAFAADVVVNEFLPNPSSGDDWVELYSSTDVDISGWVLDDEGTSTDMATIPQGTTIGPSTNQFFTIGVSNRLNQSSDTVYLYDVGKVNTVNFYTYSSNPGTDVSFGRYPNGQTWGTCSPTKNLANTGCFFPTPSPSPTPAPTATASSTATPTPTPNPTKTAIPSPTKTPMSTPQPKVETTTRKLTPSPTPETFVLGIENISPSPSAQNEATGSSKFLGWASNLPVLPFIFIILGSAVFVGSGVMYFKNKKKGVLQITDGTDNQ